MDFNFLAENNLQRLSPELHDLYTRCVAAADELLGQYLNTFPEFTDHSLLHSMEVTNLANRLISNRINELCAEELYILLMAALLHDIGMGYSPEDLEMRQPEGYSNYLKAHSGEDIHEYVRKNHHELSALFVMDFWKECLIPDEKMAAAIAEIGRGHRKTDLMDTTLYPTDLRLGKGTVNMAYLAAVIRLADDIDISSSRNLQLMFTGFVPSTNVHASAFQIHRLLTSEFADDKLILKAQTGNIHEYNELMELYRKVSETLAYCQEVAVTRAGINLPVMHIENKIQFIENVMPLVLDDTRIGDTLTITLMGKLDTTTFAQLDERLSNGLGGAVINLVLDCAELTFVSSAGLRIILGAKKKTTALKGKMTIINVSDEVMSVFRITGCDSLFNL